MPRSLASALLPTGFLVAVVAAGCTQVEAVRLSPQRDVPRLRADEVELFEGPKELPRDHVRVAVVYVEGPEPRPLSVQLFVVGDSGRGERRP